MKNNETLLLILLCIILSITIISFSISTIKTEQTYCDGWKKGYKEGYCYEVNSCISPSIYPLCPIPKVGQTTYQDGYNRGFTKGKKDKK